MSYLADIIKNNIRQQLQYEAEIERANQILDTVPGKLEQTRTEIQKAAQAATILGEAEAVAQQIYNTYPDVDVTELGLPEAEHRPLHDETEPDQVPQMQLERAITVEEEAPVDETD